MNALHAEIHCKLNEFINKIIFLEKKTVFEFKGVKLYPSEIHLILLVHEQPTNASKMAQELGVSMGAVSQTMSRLEKKGVLKKDKDPFLKNELTATFTPFGKEVFRRYKKMSKTLEKLFKDNAAVFNQKELETIDRFLDQLVNLPDQIREQQAKLRD
jgi:DNA-binding MarR family transcriptional regulator